MDSQRKHDKIREFEKWLKEDVGLEVYLVTFIDEDLADKSNIAFFSNDILEIDIKIINEEHRNKILQKSKQFETVRVNTCCLCITEIYKICFHLLRVVPT